MPCWGHHTHHHITRLHSQLSRETKFKNQQKKKNQLIWWHIPTTPTLLIWGGNSLAGAAVSILCLVGKCGGRVWGDELGVQGCSLSLESLRLLRGDTDRDHQCSLISSTGMLQEEQEQFCDELGAHAPHTRRHPCQSTLGSQVEGSQSLHPC